MDTLCRPKPAFPVDHESSRRIARSAGFVNPTGAFREVLIPNKQRRDGGHGPMTNRIASPPTFCQP
jgi:hypothetical protein